MLYCEIVVIIIIISSSSISISIIITVKTGKSKGQGCKNRAFGKPCFCWSATRHFRCLRGPDKQNALMLFCLWVECTNLSFSSPFSSKDLFSAGDKNTVCQKTREIKKKLQTQKFGGAPALLDRNHPVDVSHLSEAAKGTLCSRQPLWMFI